MLGPLGCDHPACFIKFSSFFEAQYTPGEKKKKKPGEKDVDPPLVLAGSTGPLSVHPHAAGFSFRVAGATFSAMPAQSSGSKSRSPPMQMQDGLLEQHGIVGNHLRTC